MLAPEEREVLIHKARQGKRKIRNIQITNSDIELLLDPESKLIATTINAVCAKIQADEEVRGNPRWCIFSSWLGPLVKGKVTPGDRFGYGTVEGHIKASIPDGECDSLSARSIWVIPLCSMNKTKTEHWVLAWIDFGRTKICFFDSIPENASTSWAEPLFLQIVDQIFLYMKKPLVDWKASSWTRDLYSPEYLERQLDGWSCGIFIIMALLELSTPGEMNVKNVTNKRVEEVRMKSLELMLEIPIHNPALTLSPESTESPTQFLPSVCIDSLDLTDGCEFFEGRQSHPNVSDKTTSITHPSPEPSSSTKRKRTPSNTVNSNNSSLSCSKSLPSGSTLARVKDESDGYNTDDDKKKEKRSKAAKRADRKGREVRGTSVARQN